MLVCILSSLTHFGVDPWKGAEVLADLPEADKAGRLNKMVLPLVEVPSAATGHCGIALRLVALFPQWVR